MVAQSTIRFLDRKTPPHIVTLTSLSALPALSMTLFLPSLPNMTEYFNTSYRLIQLSVPAYMLVNALLQVVIGPLSDRFGRRPLVLWSAFIFIIATIGCMLSPSVELFLVFRMLQAVIVTGIVLSRAIIRDMYPPRQAASVIGYVTMGMAIAPMIGPAIGGLLDDLFGWQASFSFLATLGLIILILSWIDQGETLEKRQTTFAEQFREYPELFKSRRFWGYCLVASFSSGTFFAYLGGAPFVGSEFFNLSAAQVGFYFGMAAFGYMMGNFASGRWSIRFGIDKMVLWGSLVCILGPIGPILLTMSGATHPMSFFGFAILIGIGNGLVMPNATAGMLSVRPWLAGSASGIGGAIMIGGGALLSALSGTLLTNESGPYPLYFLMLACTILAFAGALVIIVIARKSGPLEAPGTAN